MKTKIFSNEFNEVIVSEGDNFFDERGQFKKTIYGKASSPKKGLI